MGQQSFGNKRNGSPDFFYVVLGKYLTIDYVGKYNVIYYADVYVWW